MNEFELIDRLKPTLATNSDVLVGAGDDCAVVKAPPGETDLLLKTDAVVQGVHFDTETPPEKVGHKALGRCLSDFAAMAGTPRHAVISLGLPREFDPGFVERIYAGLNKLAARYDVAIVGGETVASPQTLFLSIAVLGTVERGQAVLRSGALAGDAIFVTGRLGGSLAGHHLEFEPRLRESRWLAKNYSIHAMIDLSDGLAGDLRHLLNASHVGAELLGTAIPISRAARLASKSDGAGKTALLHALTDGEDFELLFTAASTEAVRLLDAFRQQFPTTPLSCIGKIMPQPGVILRTRDGVRPLPAHGYVHFA